MAYNPFDFFRRNQKTFFSVLVVFVMFMFVLSFGQGDFFQWLPRWLGSKRGQGEVVATVDGRKVYGSELERLRQNRVLANQFMQASSRAAADNIARDIGDRLDATSDAAKATLTELLSSRATNYIPPNLLQFFRQGMDPQLLLSFRDQSVRRLQSSLGLIAGGADSKTAKADDVELARAALRLMQLDLSAEAANQYGYFSNLPLSEKGGERLADTLEFDLWLRKAEKLGIAIDENAVRAMYEDEFFRRVKDADFLAIEKAFGDKQGYTRTLLWAALADEFKVRAAQQAVLGAGYGRGTGGVQAFTPPYEDYQFYRDQVVAATYTMMAVPAENYLDKVAGQPTEAELRELFAKYRDREPNPASETPGFRKPRELKVGFVQVKGDEPFYAKLGAAQLAQAEAQAKLAFLLVPPAGGAAAGLLGAAAPAAVPDPALQGAYTKYEAEAWVKLDNAWRSTFTFGPHELPDASVAKPANLAAAAGAAVGTGLTHGSPFTAMLVFSERAKAEDRIARARVLATLLAPQAPGVGGSWAATAAAAAARLPGPLPLAVVRNELTDAVRKEVTRRAAEDDLRRFVTDMAPLGAKRDKSEARAHLDRWLSERGLTAGGSTGFRDVFSIEDDPGLKPLVEKKQRGHGAGDDQTLFGVTFFVEADPVSGRAGPAKSFYAPRTYPEQSPAPTLREGEPTVLFWRTEEVPAESPKSLDQARDKVVAAWKRGKARDLAKQAAEDLARQVKDAVTATRGSDQEGVLDRLLRDVHEKYVSAAAGGSLEKGMRASYFLETNVAPFPDTPESTGFNARYGPYRLKPRKELKYPSAAMESALLENKDKPLGTTLVLADQPKDVYYVATVKGRADRGSESFVSAVYRQPAMTQLAQEVNGRERAAALRQAREQAVALLEAEFKVTKDEAKLAGKDRGDADQGG